MQIGSQRHKSEDDKARARKASQTKSAETRIGITETAKERLRGTERVILACYIVITTSLAQHPNDSASPFGGRNPKRKTSI